MSEEKPLIELMIAYQKGDLSAFESLYRLIRPRLRSFLLGLTLNSALAEDLLQETFLQIHRSRATYQPGRNVLPWAFGVARYVFLMDRRGRVRRREDPALEPECIDIPVPHELDGVFDRDLFNKTLPLLHADQREALLLHHVWGFSFREIGQILGIRPVTAKLRAHRGIRSLRREFERLAVTDPYPGAKFKEK